MAPALEPASQPAAGIQIGADTDREEQLQGFRQSRRRGLVPVSEPQRECVEHDVNRPRRVGPRRRGPGRRQLPHAARAIKVPGPDRGAQRLQVRLTSRLRTQRLKARGGAEEQRGSIADPALDQGNLPAQILDVGALPGVQGTRLHRHEQAQRRVQRACVTLGPGRREHTLHAAAWFGREQRRAFQKRGWRQPASPLCPARRTFQLRGDPSSGPGAAWTRCHARRSGSASGSVTSASTACISCRSATDADR
jgi:hypothetical protein